MLDIIIIVFIGLTGFIASRKGFIKAAYQLSSFILALVISVMVYPIMSSILKLMPMYEGIKNWNIERVSSLKIIGGLQAQSDTIREATAWLPDFMSEQIVQNNNPEIYNLMHVEGLVEYISTYIADICINAMVIVIVWIIVRIILSIIVGTLDLFTKLPILNFTNKIVGFVLGITKGTCIIWLIYLVIPFLMIAPQFTVIENLLNQSILGQWLYNNNLILNCLNQTFL
ncbi:MAG: CvpA family protein [Cellulosilyticaceae bacterium]